MAEEYNFLRTNRIRALVLYVKYNRQVQYDRFPGFEQELVDECIRQGLLISHESRGKRFVTVNRGRVE